MTSVPRIDDGALAAFCRTWKIKELALFGSAGRGERRDISDIDLLVTFEDDTEWSLFDHVEMETELADLAGRAIDPITRRSVERSRNWIRRQEILSTSERVYVAG